MLRWILAFFAAALLAGIFGFGGLAGDLAWIGKTLFFVFLILLALSLVRTRQAA